MELIKRDIEDNITNLTSQYQQMPEHPKGKIRRLDVKAIANDNHKIDTEVQLTVQTYFMNRELMYAERLLAEDLARGDLYQNMPKVTVIALTNFNVREDNADIVQPAKLMFTNQPVRVHRIS